MRSTGPLLWAAGRRTARTRGPPCSCGLDASPHSPLPAMSTFRFCGRPVFIVLSRPVLPRTLVAALRRSVEKLPAEVQDIGPAVVASVGVVDDTVLEHEGAQGHQLS